MEISRANPKKIKGLVEQSAFLTVLDNMDEQEFKTISTTKMLEKINEVKPLCATAINRII